MEGKRNWKVICSLDGKEADFRLYGEYTDPRKHTFSNDRYGRGVEDYLIQRAQRINWDFEIPTYHIVPADE